MALHGALAARACAQAPLAAACLRPRPRQVLIQVADAASYMHSLHLVHCDIKADNILLKTDATRQLGFIPKVRRCAAGRLCGGPRAARKRAIARAPRCACTAPRRPTLSSSMLSHPHLLSKPSSWPILGWSRS
jgi:serine/threonine protein kinase